MLNQRLTINCKGRLLNLKEPIIMGILNVTPDSFYDGGKYEDKIAIKEQVDKMLKEGATIIDIGGMSSRPGADIISLEEELQRVIPIIDLVATAFPEAIISVDTIRAEVAERAINSGAHIINDISAGRLDAKMYETVAKLGVPYILMHMKGKPKDMQEQTNYEDITRDILSFLTKEVEKLRELGVIDIIIDPGFGFGKTIQQNYTLLQKLNIFQLLDCLVLAGLSRKSMIYKLLGTSPDQALNGTTALHMVALQQGANILRVHDVKEAKEVIELWKMVR